MERTDENEDNEHWLVFINGNRYWTTDENEKDGKIYSYAIDEEGDGTPGEYVGDFKDGIPYINTSKLNKRCILPYKFYLTQENTGKEEKTSFNKSELEEVLKECNAILKIKGLSLECFY